MLKIFNILNNRKYGYSLISTRNQSLENQKMLIEIYTVYYYATTNKLQEKLKRYNLWVKLLYMGEGGIALSIVDKQEDH